MGVAGGQGPGLPSPHAGAARVALTAVDRRRENETAQNRNARNPLASLNNAGSSSSSSSGHGQLASMARSMPSAYNDPWPRNSVI